LVINQDNEQQMLVRMWGGDIGTFNALLVKMCINAAIMEISMGFPHTTTNRTTK
jgi:hypothetical protein